MTDTGAESLYELARSGASQREFEGQHWTGSFAEYLEKLEADPRPARNAWQRMLDMIEHHGSEAGEGNKADRWKLFDDPFSDGRDAVYGLDTPLGELVNVVRAGARSLGPERRILLLHGPVGSSKSTIARLLKRGLEGYSHIDEGAIYTFSWDIDGEVIPSPMNQDPLLLVPDDARKGIAERLNQGMRREYSIAIEGELDPVSRFYYSMLMERYSGNWSKVIQHVRVHRFLFSEADRVGIGTFQPKDEKNQDSTELTGDLNYRKIAEYGSDSDPRAFNFDGEFNVANRGMLEFVEVLKLDVAFLYDLLGATQEHSIKPKKFQQTTIDEVIIGHTNEPEYKKLQNNELMEAFRDRTIKIDIPYNLRVSDEVEIYRRRYGRRDTPGRGMSPHTLEIASMWAVLTRLEDPSHPSLSLLQKAHLYDGREVAGMTRDQAVEMGKLAPREGMEGISPRYVQDRIAACLVSSRPTIGPRDVLQAIEHGLTHHSMISGEETRKHYLELVSTVREEYERIVKHEVRVAIAADREAIDRLCSKYLDNVRAYTTREKVFDSIGAPKDPDERLMRSIEEKIDIPEARKDDFRHELMNYIAAIHIEGGTFNYRENERLTRALELKMFDDRRDSIQLTSLVSTVVDPDTQEKIAVIRDRLMRQFGYDEPSADEVLREVAGLFERIENEEQERGDAAA
ncbi:MAG: serine protein kinase [Planctomycetota bacterium]|jgi:serine protein kinase